jgi:hypothetical protein
MKKLLGFFSILGLTSSLSASSVTGFSENDFDWSTPTTVVESVAKLLETRAFETRAELDSFMNSEVFGRFTHVVKSDDATVKPRDIELTYETLDDGSFNFKASMYVEAGSTLVLDSETASSRIINVTIILK